MGGSIVKTFFIWDAVRASDILGLDVAGVGDFLIFECGIVVLVWYNRIVDVWNIRGVGKVLLALGIIVVWNVIMVCHICCVGNLLVILGERCIGNGMVIWNIGWVGNLLVACCEAKVSK